MSKTMIIILKINEMRKMRNNILNGSKTHENARTPSGWCKVIRKRFTLYRDKIKRKTRKK